MYITGPHNYIKAHVRTNTLFIQKTLKKTYKTIKFHMQLISQFMSHTPYIHLFCYSLITRLVIKIKRKNCHKTLFTCNKQLHRVPFFVCIRKHTMHKKINTTTHGQNITCHHICVSFLLLLLFFSLFLRVFMGVNYSLSVCS